MRRRVILRKQIPSDLESIVDYFHAASPRTSRQFVIGYRQAVTELSKYPGHGSMKEFDTLALDGFRSWGIPGFPAYLILYRHRDDAVILYAVTHGSRDLERLLSDRV